MKFLLVLFTSLLFSSSCLPQSITIDLSGSQNVTCDAHYAVGASNDDASARTFEEIFAVNRKLAESGNTAAAFELGLTYLQGYGTSQNLVEAERWFQIGAVDPDEKSIVARLYRDGSCFPKNLKTAERWYRAAGRPGDLFELAEGFRLASPPQTDRAVAIYLDLLRATGHPELRRAQMELGNLVIDGKYTAGDSAKGRALNLEWARTITQELLGQEEYKIAVDYDISREDLPADKSMWLRFCKRAAAYNIDLAQSFYAQAIMQGEAPNFSGYDEIAWIRLASEKQVGLRTQLKAMESGMSITQHKAADDAYSALAKTRLQAGAYYPFDDPLRLTSSSALGGMPQDDPDVQIRRAYLLEKGAQHDEKIYREVMDLYRTVRDRREIDVRYVLGHNALSGTDGVPKDSVVSLHWLHIAAERGSEPAKSLLKTISQPPPAN